MDLATLSATEIAAAVRARRVSATEVARAALSRIAQLDPALHCFLHRADEHALAQAAAVDERLSREPDADLPLCGVPIALKDLICTSGLPTTCASRILAGFVPPYDATAVSRLHAAGAVIVGKLNMDEFAMGSSGEHSAFGPCRNPWDLSRVPGGSSSGAAAAVAADLCPLTLGSDTGGSIRQPAALCGVSGIKPTYGRVSRYGLVAFASSLDQLGPLSRRVEDLALCLSVIGGPDEHDATSLTTPLPNLRAACARPVRGLRIGVPEEYFAAGLDPGIERLVRAALDLLRDDGAELVPISLPHTRYAVATYYLIAMAEAASNLSRYDGVRYGLRVPAASLSAMYERSRAAGFGPEVQRRILLGTYVLRSGYYDAYYRRATRVRARIAADFHAAFARCDVIATPTSPILAFPLGERQADPLSMYLADIYTISANLAGLPAISVPCGLVAPAQGHAGLPAGLQILGPHGGEVEVLRAAAGYQRLSDWHLRRPPQPEAAAAAEAA